MRRNSSNSDWKERGGVGEDGRAVQAVPSERRGGMLDCHIQNEEKEKKQPHCRQHLKETFSCRSDGSGYWGIRHMFKCLNDGNLLDSLRAQGTYLISVAVVFCGTIYMLNAQKKRWWKEVLKAEKRWWDILIHTHTCTNFKQVSTQADVRVFSSAQPEEFLTSALLFGLWSVGATLYHIPPYLYLCAGMSLSGSHMLTSCV